jgi:hypothetical protein
MCDSEYPGMPDDEDNPAFLTDRNVGTVEAASFVPTMGVQFVSTVVKKP